MSIQRPATPSALCDDDKKADLMSVYDKLRELDDAGKFYIAGAVAALAIVSPPANEKKPQ